MPAPVPFLSTPHAQQLFPALYLYPLNDSFIPKHIALAQNQRVKIGRQTNAKTSPAERNGYFDSKVLSRQHAEVWEEGGKIYIKDVKSSNGTFINGERLSPESIESEPFQLNSDDIVEFGIDIVGEDNKTIIHHKVAARVVCVFTEQDAQVAARAEQHQGSSSMGGIANQASSSAAAPSFPFSANQGPPGSTQRRPPMQPQGLGSMGNGSIRPPGKSGLTFDHILSRLQGELQKSRETGAELHSLTNTMTDIHDTLGGSVPSNLPPYPQSLPPVRPPQPDAVASTSDHASLPAVALNELQSQLRDTQTSLATHVDKIRLLEGVLAEHEAVKREVSALREMMEDQKRAIEISQHSAERERERHMSEQEQDGFDGVDDDDGASMHTVVPHELERVDEEDEDQLAAEEEEEEERRHRRDMGRPRTPEPTGMGMQDDYDELRHQPQAPVPERRSPSPTPAVIDELTQRLTALANQLQTALELSTTLQTQHSAAQSTINELQSKVTALEVLVSATQTQVQAQAAAQEAARTQALEAARAPVEERERERESLTQMLNEWKKSVEGQWSNVQEEWNAERERLNRAREEWESRAKAVEASVGAAAARVDVGLAGMTVLQGQVHRMNGDAKNTSGLATPPSPRSLSSDSNRPRHRRKRSHVSRGRSRSQSPIGTDTTAVEDLGEQGGLEVHGKFEHEHGSRPSSPHAPDDLSDVESLPSKDQLSNPYPTPGSSVHSSPSEPIVDASKEIARKTGLPEVRLDAAFGVLVVGVVTAAVLWRVKPE